MIDWPAWSKHDNPAGLSMDDWIRPATEVDLPISNVTAISTQPEKPDWATVAGVAQHRLLNDENLVERSRSALEAIQHFGNRKGAVRVCTIVTVCRQHGLAADNYHVRAVSLFRLDGERPGNRGHRDLEWINLPSVQLA
jgi:hypothetical protein